MSAILEAALAYAAHGWPVFPVGRDKAPLTKHGFQDASTHPELIREWWREHPDGNVALGIPQGLVVLDFDPRNGAPDPGVFQWGPRYPLRAETPSGGSHLYFRVPDVELVGKWMPGIDVKAGGKGYVLLPPSTNGEREYTWYRGEDPADGFWELESLLTELPAWVLTAITKRHVSYDLGLASTTAEPTFSWDLGTSYGTFGLQAMLGLMAMARNGERNNALNRAAYRIGQYVAAGEVKEEALYELARIAEWTGLERDEIAETIRSAYEAGTRKPWTR